MPPASFDRLGLTKLSTDVRDRLAMNCQACIRKCNDPRNFFRGPMNELTMVRQLIAILCATQAEAPETQQTSDTRNDHAEC